MTRYNVHLYRTVRLLFNGIQADTPKAAAAIARIGLTSNADEIDDGYADDVSAQIDVAGDNPPKHSVTIHFEPERLRKAAPRLLNALMDLLGDQPSVQNGRCVHCGREYHDIETGNCPSEDCPSFEPRALLAELGTLAINSPTSERKPIMTRKLPPDPEHRNDDRAACAGRALAAFMHETGADEENALGDLLTDLMHWCDRHDFDFDAGLDRARAHYDAETVGV